jgi:hypothetical protein
MFHARGKQETCTGIILENFHTRNNLGDININGAIITKLILEK